MSSPYQTGYAFVHVSPEKIVFSQGALDAFTLEGERVTIEIFPEDCWLSLRTGGSGNRVVDGVLKLDSVSASKIPREAIGRHYPNHNHRSHKGVGFLYGSSPAVSIGGLTGYRYMGAIPKIVASTA